MVKRVLFLPGASKKNKKMVEEAKTLFDDVTTITYEHWDTDEELDIENEKAKLKEEFDVVIAKSIGAYLALSVPAKKHVLLGFPLRYLEGKGIALPEPTSNMTIIQNKNDRAGSIEAIKKVYLDAKMVKNHRENHTYKVEDALPYVN